MQGTLLTRLTWPERSLAALGALLLISSSWLTDLAGLACLAFVVLRQVIVRRHSAPAPATAAPLPAVPDR